MATNKEYREQAQKGYGAGLKKAKQHRVLKSKKSKGDLSKYSAKRAAILKADTVDAINVYYDMLED